MTTETSALPAELERIVQGFDSWADDLALRQQQACIIEAPLYHYTNASGLKGIFDSKQIWFTDYRHLNDPGELRYGFEIAKRAFDAAASGAVGAEKALLEFAGVMIGSERLHEVFGFFVASFSRAPNDLGQWRAYADNGRGFAIGFSPKMFAMQDVPRQAPNENAFISPMNYESEETIRRHREGIERARLCMRDAVSAHLDLLQPVEVGREFIRRLVMRLVSSVTMIVALGTKHPAYAPEQEVRLVALGEADSLLRVTQTRIRGGEMTPYIIHPWPISGSDDIAEIVVGPAAPADTERALRTYLATLGLDGVSVSRSDIPYRPV